MPSITGSNPYSIPNFFSNFVIWGTLAAIDLIQFVIFLEFSWPESDEVIVDVMCETLAAYLVSIASEKVQWMSVGDTEGQCLL